MKAQVFLFVCLLVLAAKTAVSKGKHRSFCSLAKCKDRPRWKKFYFVSASPIYPGYCVGS